MVARNDPWLKKFTVPGGLENMEPTARVPIVNGGSTTKVLGVEPSTWRVARVDGRSKAAQELDALVDDIAYERIEVVAAAEDVGD